MEKGFELVESSRGRETHEQIIVTFQVSEMKTQAKKLVIIRMMIIMINLKIHGIKLLKSVSQTTFPRLLCC